MIIHNDDNRGLSDRHIHHTIHSYIHHTHKFVVQLIILLYI